MNSKGSSCMWIFSDKCIQYYKIWGWLNLRMWNLGYGSPANGLGYLQTLVSWADPGTSPHGCWGTAVLSKHSGSSCCLLDTLMYSLSLFLMNNLGVFWAVFGLQQCWARERVPRWTLPYVCSAVPMLTWLQQKPCPCELCSWLRVSFLFLASAQVLSCVGDYPAGPVQLSEVWRSPAVGPGLLLVVLPDVSCVFCCSVVKCMHGTDGDVFLECSPLIVT